jgi:hypothetical protein
MPRKEGTAHGKHYTEQDDIEDKNRNYNQSEGRRHTDQTDEDARAGGHSDRWADSSSEDSPGRQHEQRAGGTKEEARAHDNEQSEDRMQGQARKEGGHQTGRNQTNSR